MKASPHVDGVHISRHTHWDKRKKYRPRLLASSHDFPSPGLHKVCDDSPPTCQPSRRAEALLQSCRGVEGGPPSREQASRAPHTSISDGDPHGSPPASSGQGRDAPKMKAAVVIACRRRQGGVGVEWGLCVCKLAPVRAPMLIMKDIVGRYSLLVLCRCSCRIYGYAAREIFANNNDDSLYNAYIHPSMTHISCHSHVKHQTIRHSKQKKTQQCHNHTCVASSVNR